MAYFDLASIEVGKEKAAILGYRKIFSAKDLTVVDNLNFSGSCIVKSGEIGLLRRAVRKNNVVGIMIDDSELLKLALEEAVENDKAVFISLHEILCSDTRSRLRNIYRMKGLIASAMRSKAKIAMVTLADDDSCLISSMQMLELARFLGATEVYAKKMASSLGEVL